MTLYGRKVGKSTLMALMGSQSISRTMEPKTTCRQAEGELQSSSRTQSSAPPSAPALEGGGGRRRGLTDHREDEPPQVSVNGKVNHLLNRVKVRIVEVPQEPQNTWSEDLGAQRQHLLKRCGAQEPPARLEALPYLSQQQDEGGQVEDVDHAHQPVEEHGGPRRRGQALLPVLQGGVKHLLRATSTSYWLSADLQEPGQPCQQSFCLTREQMSSHQPQMSGNSPISMTTKRETCRDTKWTLKHHCHWKRAHQPALTHLHNNVADAQEVPGALEAHQGGQSLRGNSQDLTRRSEGQPWVRGEECPSARQPGPPPLSPAQVEGYVAEDQSSC